MNIYLIESFRLALDHSVFVLVRADTENDALELAADADLDFAQYDSITLIESYGPTGVIDTPLNN